MLIFLPLIGQEIFSNLHEMLCYKKQKHVVMEYKQIQLPYIKDEGASSISLKSIKNNNSSWISAPYFTLESSFIFMSK